MRDRERDYSDDDDDGEEYFRKNITLIKNYDGEVDQVGVFEFMENEDVKKFFDVVDHKIKLNVYSKFDGSSFNDYQYSILESITHSSYSNTFMGKKFKSNQALVTNNDIPEIFPTIGHDNIINIKRDLFEFFYNSTLRNIDNFARLGNVLSDDGFRRDSIPKMICRYIFTANPTHYNYDDSDFIPKFLVIFDTDRDLMNINYKEIRTIDSYRDLINCILYNDEILTHQRLIGLNNRIKLYALIGQCPSFVIIETIGMRE